MLFSALFLFQGRFQDKCHKVRNRNFSFFCFCFKFLCNPCRHFPHTINESVISNSF